MKTFVRSFVTRLLATPFVADAHASHRVASTLMKRYMLALLAIFVASPACAQFAPTGAHYGGRHRTRGMEERR
jgi:hypothetical protein